MPRLRRFGNGRRVLRRRRLIRRKKVRLTRRINRYRTPVSRMFSRAAIRVVSQAQTWRTQILGTVSANNTLHNVNTTEPQFINLSEVLQTVVLTHAGEITGLEVYKTFVESCLVKLYVTNKVASTGFFNGNKLRIRIVEFYLNKNQSYIATDAAGSSRPTWSNVDPTTGAAYDPTATLLWMGRQYNYIANEGDWNWPTDAALNYTVVKYPREHRFNLMPIPNTGTNPGCNWKEKTFRWNPRRPMTFQTQPAFDTGTNTFTTNTGQMFKYLMVLVDDPSLAPGTKNNAIQIRGEMVTTIRNLN